MSELLQLDLFGARTARDEGIATAIEHADKVHDGWSEKAYQFLSDYLKENKGLFMAEDVRNKAIKEAFPAPPDQRAWGAVFVRAVKAGIIKRRGYAQVKNPVGHCHPAAVWQGV